MDGEEEEDLTEEGEGLTEEEGKGESFEVDRRTKRMAPTRILEILHRHSDADHPMSQDDIISFLEAEYAMPVRRRAVSFSVALLRDSGFEIESVSPKGGIYLAAREFDDDELRLLISAVVSDRDIPEARAGILKEKLRGLSSIYFDPHAGALTLGDRRSSDDGGYLAALRTLSEAIDAGMRVRAALVARAPDGAPVNAGERVFSPYEIASRGGRRYLVARDEEAGETRYIPLDRIGGVTPLPDEATPRDSGPEPVDGTADDLPFGRPGERDEAEIVADAGMLDEIAERFGDAADICEEDGRYRVYVSGSMQAVERWATENLDSVEVVAPGSLRARMLEKVSRAAERYSQDRR